MVFNLLPWDGQGIKYEHEEITPIMLHNVREMCARNVHRLFREWWELQFNWWLSDLFVKCIQHFLTHVILLIKLIGASNLSQQHYCENFDPTSGLVQMISFRWNFPWSLDPEVPQWNLITFSNTPFIICLSVSAPGVWVFGSFLFPCYDWQVISPHCKSFSVIHNYHFPFFPILTSPSM